MNNAFAIGVLARYRAKKAVKHELYARGIKLSYVSNREIATLTNAYLAQHQAELVAPAEMLRTMEVRNDRAGNGMARRTTVSQAS